MGQGRPLRRGLIGVAAGIVMLIAPAGASAATITVHSAFEGMIGDPQCSLREAVTAANTNAGDTNAACTNGDVAPTLDTIVFTGQPFVGLAGSGDDTNMTGDLDIFGGTTGPVRIDGSGLIMGRQIFDIDDDSGVIHVLSGGTLTVANLEVNGGSAGTILDSGTLTVEGATVADGTTIKGGGILASVAAGNLTIINSEVSGNTAEGASTGLIGGGGILYEGTGSLTVTNSLISDNHANETTGGGGGGISFAPISGTGSLTITNSTITGNDTLGFTGGGVRVATNVMAVAPNTTIIGSSISNNHANDGAGARGGGGGISFTDETAKLRVLDSTISGNTAAGATWQGGGGIKVYDGQAAIVNSTISGNTASASKGGGLSGGAPSGSAPPISVIHSTVAGNMATDDLGLHAYDGTVTLRNSIIANGATACGNETVTGEVTTAGFNVDEGTSCDLSPAMSDAEGVPAGLGALAANGGPTMTYSIGMSSPAFNRVPAASCTNDLAAALTTDQRGAGFIRPALGACDSGAFEIQPPPPPAQPGATPGSARTPVTKCKKKKKKRKPRSAIAAKKKKKKKCGKRKRKRR